MIKKILRTRRGLLALLLLIIGGIYAINKYIFTTSENAQEFNVPSDNVYTFPGIAGPSKPSVVQPKQPTSWRKFSIGAPSSLAIFLTDTQSNWLGLAQGFRSIGIPFTITTNINEALSHKVVMVYPLISGKVLKREELQALAAVPRNGGTLIATNVYGGGLNEVFAYQDYIPRKSNTRLVLNPGKGVLHFDSVFSDAQNHEIVLVGSNLPDVAPGLGYTGAKTSLINFNDSTSALAYKDYGIGKAYAFGLDLGNYFLRNMNARGFEPNRAYANSYEAGIDILLRMLKQIYVAGEPNAVTISPVPAGKPFTMILTHDIDFTRSMVNAAAYAAMERDHGVKATYFIQTKYVKDWNDDIFFNADNVKYLQQVEQAGMEIGSHSVSHSRVFSKFPLGTGKESYPQYKPFVKAKELTYNGSILGELRVSKLLLEHNLRSASISSFRPGHLQYPFALPQALQATGFTNSSAITAGTVQTNLPYMLMYDREFDAELGIVEVPIAVEDELGLPMLRRFDSTLLLARKLAAYGGVLNILIHTDTLGQKFEYEQKVIDTFKNVAWVSTIGAFCDWWRQRNDVKVAVKDEGGKKVLTVSGPVIKGLTLQVPPGWMLQPDSGHALQQGSAVIISELASPAILTFSVK